MPSTTRSAFFSNANKGQNIMPEAPIQKVEVTEVKESEVKEPEMITITKAQYDMLIESNRQLIALKEMLNK